MPPGPGGTERDRWRRFGRGGRGRRRCGRRGCGPARRCPRRRVGRSAVRGLLRRRTGPPRPSQCAQRGRDPVIEGVRGSGRAHIGRACAGQAGIGRPGIAHRAAARGALARGTARATTAVTCAVAVAVQLPPPVVLVGPRGSLLIHGPYCPWTAMAETGRERASTGRPASYGWSFAGLRRTAGVTGADSGPAGRGSRMSAGSPSGVVCLPGDAEGAGLTAEHPWGTPGPAGRQALPGRVRHAGPMRVCSARAVTGRAPAGSEAGA